MPPMLVLLLLLLLLLVLPVRTSISIPKDLVTSKNIIDSNHNKDTTAVVHPQRLQLDICYDGD